MSRWDQPHDRSSSRGPAPTFPYVLVADADPRRMQAAVAESATVFGAGVLVARDGEDAADLIARFGPPRLLITDLSLPRKDGFAVIEALRRVDHGRSAIVAWAANRELREFAAHRLANMDVKVLGGGVSPAVLRKAIEWGRQRSEAASARSDPEPAARVEAFHQRMSELADEARQICGTAGAAVYARSPEDPQFRVCVTWTSDAPMPPSPEVLPPVFERILQRGEVLVWPDLANEPVSGGLPPAVGDAVRGLAAVPILNEDREAIGAIFVFDVKPLVFVGSELDALKLLGHGGTALSATTAVPVDDGGSEPAPSDRIERPPDVPRDAPRPDSQPALLDRDDATLAVARELARARRDRLSLSVILFEVKRGNDSSWDPLAVVGDTLARAIRGSDLTVRWDREQLLIVLTGIGEAAARHVAERVRAALQAGAGHRLAVSGGVAELAGGDSFQAVVARASDRVQAAIARGHNRIA